MNIGPVVGILLASGACDGADPAKGGFFAGLSGLAGGCYEKRVEERQDAVREREQTRDSLEAQRWDLEVRSAEAGRELDRLRAEHMELKRRIVRLNSNLAARRVQLDASTRARLHAVLSSQAGEEPAIAYGGQPAAPFGGQPAESGVQPASPLGAQPAAAYRVQPAAPFGAQTAARAGAQAAAGAQRGVVPAASEAERIASLRSAIEDARALVDKLSSL